MSDDAPGGGEEPPDREGETYRLAVPGPFGKSWTRAVLEADTLTLSGDGRRAILRYVDLRALDSVPVSDRHGETRIVADLVVLGAAIVLTGATALGRRLTTANPVTPHGLSRYANEVVATEPLVRLRLATGDKTYYLYADRDTAESLSGALRRRRAAWGDP
ncbi:hypothetical protein [Halorarum halobium]|uniref:hypothetical protein n=1 Tax=Halorarum halobium TaxID=3075121 RepID=UPI0028AB0599|nr:hypothetical protein [Halobaculum sp. XH14]